MMNEESIFPLFIHHSSLAIHSSFIILNSSFKKLWHTTKTNATILAESIQVQLENKQSLSRAKTISNRVISSKAKVIRTTNSKVKATGTTSSKIIKTKAFSSNLIRATQAMRDILYRQAAT